MDGARPVKGRALGRAGHYSPMQNHLIHQSLGPSDLKEGLKGCGCSWELLAWRGVARAPEGWQGRARQGMADWLGALL